uniref:glycosyltransferase n=1 Tax=Streptococcus merionis TaxID=400065 RepID=UPI0026EDE717
DFIGYFLETLNLTSQDLLIIDRETGMGQAILEHKGAAHTAVVIHAEHFSPNEVYDDTILWNNYYEYQFTHGDDFKHFIASTAVQRDLLLEQLERYSTQRPLVHAIPVGSIDELKVPRQERQPFSLITASRLAGEKHIDWLIMAVTEARQTLPELTLDIYGQGGEYGKLQDLIQSLGATDYIQLKGHADLTDIYQHYDAYVAASTSEGFGLTLLEAIGSGLPIIGLDVRYGNQTFIDDGKNGYLIPRHEPDNPQDMAKAFSQKICQLYREADLPAWRQHSYAKAQPYLTINVEKEWQAFIEEVVHD